MSFIKLARLLYISYKLDANPILATFKFRPVLTPLLPLVLSIPLILFLCLPFLPVTVFVV